MTLLSFFGTAYFFFNKEWAKIPAVVLLAVIGFVSMATFKRKGKKLHAIIADKREASYHKYKYIYDMRRIVLCLTAGAMLYVVVEELVPEYSQGKHSNIVMMVLDVVLS